MKIGYYPGCTLKTKARNLEQSAIEAMSLLGYELEELERWNCCGAVYSLADDDLVHLLAPVRDLIRAKDAGYDKLVVLCSMCYNTLARANNLMRDDKVKRKTLNDFMEEESDYVGEVEVVHLLSFLRDEIGWDKVREAVKQPLDDIKLAPYYGCTLTRPRDVSVDGNVNPQIFREFVEALGAMYIEWDEVESCCGSYQVLSNPEAAKETVTIIIGSAQGSGADAMILSCPLCDYNLGKRQGDLVGGDGEDQLPVFYFTQLFALALGLLPESCKFELNPEASNQWLEEKRLVAVPA